jgi:glutaredoxin
MNTPSSRPALIALLALSALPALAQYKVVRPDGSVTYTDRPPVEANVRVTPLGRNAAAAAAAAASAENQLPAELRQAVSRYPVTLYTSADCAPCDSGRKLLQQRGIPYSERRVSTEEDALALERAVGGRTVPGLTIGAQQLRGYAESDWSTYLDAAGYPSVSKLPRNWPVPTPTPLVERATPAPAPARAAAPAPAPAPEPEPAQPATAIRF